MTDTNEWTVVLIDDEADIREVTQMTLRDAGYRVATAPDGETGLGVCGEMSPQVVITDIRMPGMDGLQVLETLKCKTPDIEVIVATAFGEMDLAIRALQLDASDFITKPIDIEALHLALRRAKHRYTSRKQLADYTALLEKEKAETVQELAKTVAYQRNLIESSMDGIIGCDENGMVVMFNKSMEDILGFSRTGVIGKMAIDKFLQPGEAGKMKAELRGDKYGGKNRLFLYETTLVGKTERIPAQVSASVLYDRENEAGAVWFFRDLRQIKRLEREVADQASILHQDKMMSLGRLAASVVHEINNPLSGILNYLKLMSRILKRGSPTKDQYAKFERYLDIVENETGRCSRIISSLLTFSRKSSAVFAPVGIDELLERCVLLAKHKLDMSNIELVHTVESDIPPALGDFNQLQQCVINLIFNAIDAMPDGGTLTLSAYADTPEKKAVIVVEDSGTGMASDQIRHIFEPFFTTKSEGHGVGLGLSTVFGIIERHNGKVAVKSEPGKGAAFYLRIPLAEVKRSS